MRYPTEKRARERLDELLGLLAHYRGIRRAAEADGDAQMLERAEDAIRMQHVLIRAHCADNGLPQPHDVAEGDGEGIRPEIQALAHECARAALASAPAGGAKLACDVDESYLEELARVLGRPYTDVERYAFRVAFEHALGGAGAIARVPDVRKQRRAEVRLAALQSDLNRFRGNFYVAIGRGDPGWVKRCHKAIREQQDKIRRLCAVYGIEPPPGLPRMNA